MSYENQPPQGPPGYPPQGPPGYPPQGYQLPGPPPGAPQGMPAGQPSPPSNARRMLPLAIGGGFGFLLLVWLAYQHLYAWGWSRTPSDIRSAVEPFIDEVDTAAEEAFRICSDPAMDHRFDLPNPLANAAVLRSPSLRYADLACRNNVVAPELRRGADGQVEVGRRTVTGAIFARLTTRESMPGLSLFNQVDGEYPRMRCKAPNILGLSDHTRSHCLTVLPSGGTLFQYNVTRSVTNPNGERAVTITLEFQRQP